MNPISGALILLLEDEFMIAMDAEEILLELGAAEVVVASTLEMASERVKERRFDVAVLDVNINGERSFPVALELANAGTPIVFASGYELRDRTLPADLEGVFRLTKPYSAARLKEVINAAMIAHGRPASRSASAPAAHPS